MTGVADDENGARNGLFARLWHALKRLGQGEEDAELALRRGLENLIEEHGEEQGLPDPGEDELQMLFNILKNGDLRVHEIMVPRVDVIAVGTEQPLEELVKLFVQAGHSRLPVYRDSLDNILGMIHVKDALKALSEAEDKDAVSISDLLRGVLFVAPSMRAMDLLAKMRARRTHMAVVVDEYGGTDGLVTIEDLVEQIVGNIEDEHDRAEPVLMRRRNDGAFDADARLPVSTLEEALGVSLLDADRDEDVDTLGGLVFSIAGRVPERAECILHRNGYRFEVLDADPRRVRRIRVHLPEDGPERARPEPDSPGEALGGR